MGRWPAGAEKGSRRLGGWWRWVRRCSGTENRWGQMHGVGLSGESNMENVAGLGIE